MKKILLLLLIAPVLGYGQGEQRYADGTATDQDGNTFEWINYGTQDWAIENAEVVTYRDGTDIPLITDATGSLTGAIYYFNDDPAQGKLYNGYAVLGVHDNDENTPNKAFAPEGWRVPTEADWTTLENYLIDNGYNYDDTTTDNKIAKSMASTTGWYASTTSGAVGNDQSLNNSSGFNALPEGYRAGHTPVSNFSGGSFNAQSTLACFWSSTEKNPYDIWNVHLYYNESDPRKNRYSKQNGFSVRFVRDASTASIKDYSNAITIYPNPTTSIVTLQGGKQYNIEVYDLLGNKVMSLTGNNINMAHLSTATYIVKATDKSNNEEMTYKVVKN